MLLWHFSWAFKWAINHIIPLLLCRENQKRVGIPQNIRKNTAIHAYALLMILSKSNSIELKVYRVLNNLLRTFENLFHLYNDTLLRFLAFILLEIWAFEVEELEQNLSKKRPLRISTTNRETYENFGSFGISIVDLLGYGSVSKFYEVCCVKVPSSLDQRSILTESRF